MLQGQKETGGVRLEVRVGDLTVELGPLGTKRTPAGAGHWEAPTTSTVSHRKAHGFPEGRQTQGCSFACFCWTPKCLQKRMSISE